MRVQPVPQKRIVAVSSGVRGDTAPCRQKKLRRLPHLFSKVLELPIAADADVVVEEAPDSLRFLVADFDPDAAPVRAHTMDIFPGIMKVVILEDAAATAADDDQAPFDLNRWRFRLPSCTLPALATAACVGGDLVVTVPKGMEDDGGDGFTAVATTLMAVN